MGCCMESCLLPGGLIGCHSCQDQNKAGFIVKHSARNLHTQRQTPADRPTTRSATNQRRLTVSHDSPNDNSKSSTMGRGTSLEFITRALHTPRVSPLLRVKRLIRGVCELQLEPRPSKSPPRSSSSGTTPSSPWTSRPTSASAMRSPSSPPSV
jgi:hypothetical protein